MSRKDLEKRGLHLDLFERLVVLRLDELHVVQNAERALRNLPEHGVLAVQVRALLKENGIRASTDTCKHVDSISRRQA